MAALKQQIRVLQAVGFGAVEGEEAAAVGSLEVKLLEKLRALEHQLTMARLQDAQSAGQSCTQGLQRGPTCSEPVEGSSHPILDRTRVCVCFLKRSGLTHDC